MKGVLMCLAAVLVVSSADGQGIKDNDSIERPFAEGGAVTLNLASGDYTVRAGAASRKAGSSDRSTGRALEHIRSTHACLPAI
jgi:hypothetical protein